MIDWKRVSELREEVGAEDFDEVVELFLLEVDEEIGQLTTQIAPQTLAEKLHFLKGSALSLGFAEFSQRCAAAEQEMAQTADTSVDIDGIKGSFSASRSQFIDELPEHMGDQSSL